jgi:hypothetical protein
MAGETLLNRYCIIQRIEVVFPELFPILLAYIQRSNGVNLRQIETRLKFPPDFGNSVHFFGAKYVGTALSTF